MHICVQLGAQENLKFIEYVNFLDTENYIPKNSKKWVDIIRKKGNDVNHEIVILNQKEAEQLITFSGIIINLIYENALAGIKYKPRSSDSWSEFFSLLIDAQPSPLWLVIEKEP